MGSRIPRGFTQKRSLKNFLLMLSLCCFADKGLWRQATEFLREVFCDPRQGIKQRQPGRVISFLNQK